ncbi:MAG: hypothetical protein J7L22_09650 [Candidatus Marinimicrobia bacterium]|nr:hypothetical protein [Candidatus Neomarinimicrobiota bacterium]RKY59138.1 MAG: hypothetical protein DRP96_07395 [Candidatus Neomarinimicrobiota bacterium]
MLTRLSIEVDRNELIEFKEVLEKLTSNQPSVEIKLNSTIRGICRLIIKDIDKWENFKSDRW